MKEKEDKTEPTEANKMKSRKFLVWLVWLTMSVLILAFCAIVIIKTKPGEDALVPFFGLIEKVLGWFFALSMMYLGVNVGQKIGFALTDAWSEKNEEEHE